MKKSKSWLKRLAVLVMAVSIVVSSFVGVQAEEGVGGSSNIVISTNYQTHYQFEQETVFSADNTLKLGVEASSNNGPVSYQWYCNEEEIEGATTNTYTIDNLTINSSNPEFIFRCEVKDGTEAASQGFTLSYIINVQIDAAGGTYTRTMGTEVVNGCRHDGFGFIPGISLAENGISISELSYWKEREFLGWEVNHWGIVTDDNNNSWESWTPVSTNYLTTSEMLAAKNTESTLYRAVWGGNDENYGSGVHFECYGGSVTASDSYGGSWTMDNFGSFLQENPASTIASELGHTISDPTQEGFTFEGWLEFSMDNGELISVDENGNYVVYTTEAVLSRVVPSYNVRFAAKWEEIDIAEYMQSGPGEMVGTEFKTEDELHALLSENVMELAYAGTTALVLTKDITIPNGTELYMNDQDLIIGSGVTMQANGRVHCDELTVNGVLEVNEQLDTMTGVTVNGEMILNRNIMAGSNLVVNGTVNIVEDQISMNYPAAITGIDNIQFSQDWQMIRVEVPVASFNDLKTSLSALASSHIDHSRVIYNIWIQEDSLSTNEFVISENITIPSYVEIHLNERLNYVIAEGATLTVEGNFNMNGKLTINGSLVNNGVINIQHMDDQVGELVKGSNGSLSGDGEIQLHYDTNISSWKDLMTGFNTDDYDVANQNTDPEGNTHTHIKNVSGLIKLGTPINLSWGKEYREKWHWDETTEEDVFDGYEVIDKPGMSSWETVTPDQAEVSIKIYRVGENTPCAEGRWGFGEEFQPKYRSIDPFMTDDLGSGSYYFTVQSLGDYIEYRNSDIAVSGVYEYVKPEERLGDCIDFKWEEREDDDPAIFRWFTWKNPDSNSEYIDGYQIEFYYSDEIDGEYEQFSGIGGRNNVQTEEPFFADFLRERGIGYYKFRMRALSSNIEKCLNSMWSEFSPILNVVEVSREADQSVDQMLNAAQKGTVAPDIIKSAVQSMDTKTLAAALNADNDNSGTTEKLADLESLLEGGPAQVQVTQAASAFAANEVSIVGANLNTNVSEDADPITLVVDKPSKDHVIPELYNSAVAVKFSMTLENVENPEKLEVPVKITLPVPESINPDFLVIFHYHADGSRELIRPYVYEENGKYYTNFVLTSFSDFTMTQLHECVWDEGEVISEPTCTQDGEILYTCTVDECDETHTGKIPAGHSLEKVEAKAATYEAEGNIEYYACENCDLIFADEEGSEEIKLADTVIKKLEKGEDNSETSQPNGNTGTEGDSSSQPDDNTDNKDEGDKKPEDSNIGVDTGDHSQPVMYVLLIVICMVGLAAMLRMKKKSKTK